MAEGNRYGRDEIEFARALTFFDAIYAFALTLLVTTIDDFSPQAWSSLPALWEANGYALTSFFISFIVVVRFWEASHKTLGTFRYLNSRLIGLSTVAMLGVVLIPFTTEAMGEPGIRDLPLPIAAYAVNVSFVFVVQLVVAVLADRADLRDHRMSARELRVTVAQGVSIPLVFLASIPVAYLVSPGTAQLSWASLPIIIPLVARIAGGRSTATPEQHP